MEMRTVSETSGTHKVQQHLNHRGPRRRGKGYEKIFEEIIVKSFANMRKETATQVQEAQRVPYRINLEKKVPRHIIELMKISAKGKVLKATREKQQITYKGIPIRLTADLSIETADQKGVAGYT